LDGLNAEGFMSGGSFNYAYAQTIDFADSLMNMLESQGEDDPRNGFPEPEWEREVTLKLKFIAYAAHVTGALMKEAEWLYSGDTSEATFLKRVNEIEGRWKAHEALQDRPHEPD
jgi:hypothetical protein